MVRALRGSQQGRNVRAFSAPSSTSYTIKSSSRYTLDIRSLRGTSGLRQNGKCTKTPYRLSHPLAAESCQSWLDSLAAKNNARCTAVGELRPGRDTGSGMEAAGVTPNLVFGEGAGGGLAKEVDWNPVVVEPDLELACNEALPRPLGGASLAGGEAKGELFAAGEEPEVGVVRSTLGAQSAPHAFLHPSRELVPST